MSWANFLLYLEICNAAFIMKNIHGYTLLHLYLYKIQCFMLKNLAFTDVGFAAFTPTGRINPSLLSIAQRAWKYVCVSLSKFVVPLFGMVLTLFLWGIFLRKRCGTDKVVFFLIASFLWPFFWPQVKMSHHPPSQPLISFEIFWSAARHNLSPQCHFLTAPVSITLYIFPWLQKSIDHYKVYKV